LGSILKSKGLKSNIYSYDKLPGFFEDIKQEEVNGYGLDALKAIRDSDVGTLRAFHAEGRPLKCSNRFGESLLHMACRKALVPVVDFLVNEVQVPVCVTDDMGRSPLHDAFWTIEPNFELMDILLRKCPDLLWISDKRGHTPLSYARPTHWTKWNEYLKNRSEMVTPIMLPQYEMIAEAGYVKLQG
jgi:ankyrin repeat protein